MDLRGSGHSPAHHCRHTVFPRGGWTCIGCPGSTRVGLSRFQSHRQHEICSTPCSDSVSGRRAAPGARKPAVPGSRRWLGECGPRLQGQLVRPGVRPDPIRWTAAYSGSCFIRRHPTRKTEMQLKTERELGINRGETPGRNRGGSEEMSKDNAFTKMKSMAP